MKLIGNNHSNKHGAHSAEHKKHSHEAAAETSVPVDNTAAAVPAAEDSAAPTPKAGKAKGGMKKGVKVALICLAVVVVVALGVVIGYSMWEAPPPVAGPTQILTTPSPTPTAAPTPGTQSGEDEPVESEPPEVEVPVDEFDGELVTERDDGIYTFLLVGRDYASNSTDTIIVGKFDTNKHTIDLVNIPRDTLININWGTTPKKINAVYPGYTNSGYSGINGLLDHVKNFIGFNVDFYAVVNINVVVDVIDAVGGVDFDVPINMDYDDPSQGFHVHLKKGMQHLNGYEALGVFRFRTGGYVNGVKTEGYPGGDVQRIQTQQALLMALAKQTLSLGNIPNLTNIIDACVKNVETTLTAPNMAFFARQFLKCSSEDINFREMPISTYSVINGVSYVSVAINDWIDVINDYLNPYSQPVTKSNVSIITANETGTWIDSTTGYIAGSWESFYCQTCSAKNGWKAVCHTPGACPSDEPGVSEDPFEEELPSTDTPSTDVPITEAPTDDPFTSDTPATDTPSNEPPPTADNPVVETPPADTPLE